MALLGGSFDPVHHGHLRMAIEAAQALDADVALVPSGTPPHRTPPHATPGERLAMIELALSGQARITVDARELARAGPNYTVDTLREMRGSMDAGRSLMVLIGSDQFALLDTWHEWRTLFELAHVVVMARGGATARPSAVVEAHVHPRWVADPTALRGAAAGLAMRIETTALDISSSRIRADLAAGVSPRWLLPDAVLRYIEVQALYQTLPAAPQR